MTCREFVDFLADYVSGQLSPPQAAAFRKHLSRCPPCVAYTNTYLEAVRLGQAALRSDETPVPADLPEELVKSILLARTGS